MGPLEYKGIVLIIGSLAGIACIYMGYRLFLKGVVEKGSLHATGGGFAVTWRDYGPGVAFALFGALILGICVTRDLRTETERLTDEFGAVTTRDQISAAAGPARSQTAESPPPPK